ncbi:MAG: hypothetical protein IJH34_12695, partial [Romboutsia sp.]|nr:hypothetical protein [Romboutsia sp.]
MDDLIKKIIKKQNDIVKQSQNSNKDTIVESTLMENLIYNDKRASLEKNYCDNSLNEIESSASNKISTFKGITQDIFNLLFQIESKNVDDDKLSSTAKRFNKQLINQIRESKELDSLRLSTVGDSDESIQACSIVMNDIYDKLDYYIKNIYGDELSDESIQKFENILEQKREQLNDAIRKYNSASDNNLKDRLSNNIKKLDNEIDGLENKIKKMTEEIQFQSNLNKNTLNTITDDILKHAQEEIESNQMLSNNFGVGKDSGVSYTVEEKREILQKLKSNQTILNIAKMMGKIKLSFEKNDNGKFEKNRGEIIGIETGDDLSRVLSSELALLASPNTKPLFYAKYAQKELLQYKRAEKQIMNKGNCIILADESGSTTYTDNNGYSAFYYTKAIAVFLANLLSSQNRELVYLPFSGCLGETFIINKETLNVESITRMSTNFLGGGTDFNLVLT